MAINTVPIVSKAPDVQWIGPVTAANSTKDLTSGTIYLAFQANTTNGGFVQRIRFRPLGTNAAQVARVWLNNNGTTTTATNNTLWDEMTLAATTVSEVAAVALYELPINFGLPAAHRIYVTIGTTNATAGFAVTVIGGSY